MIFLSTKSQHHQAYQNFCLHFTSHVWWVGGQIEISSFFQKILSKLIKIKIIFLVNRRSTSSSIPKVLSTFYFSRMVGGRIKISSFPKRFYQNINYIKFSQKILSKYKLYQVFSKAFIKSWNWDRALWALTLRPFNMIANIYQNECQKC